MLKKTILVILSAALFLGAFSACKKEEAAPEVDLTGFETTGEAAGGTAGEGFNLKGISSYTDNAGDACIALSFITGSMLAGEAEGAAAAPPEYRVYMLDAPYRLVVELGAVEYFDYERDFSGIDDALVIGMFRSEFSAETVTELYFQLSGPAAFRTEENGGSVEISLRGTEVAAESDEENGDDGDVVDFISGAKFFAVSNKYRDYCNGGIPRGSGVTPTFNDSLDEIMLISEGFYSELETQTFIDGANEANPLFGGPQWSVVQLENGARPGYSEELDTGAAYGEKPARVNGTPIALSVLMDDGFYLSYTPDKSGYIYGKRVAQGYGTDERVYEKIFYMPRSGTGKEYLKYEFETIEKAAFSPDGRKLAVLERAQESSHLYIFDMDTHEMLTDLALMGLSDMISAFTWDALGTTIYSVSGSNTVQVHQYDFNVPDENKRHSVVDKNSADEGSIAFSSGELYFVETTMNEGAMIYRIKPEGGVRKSFRKGSSFLISDNGKYMLISAPGEDSAAGGGDTFEIYDMETGVAQLITNDFAVYDYIWSKDCTKVYYFENKLTGSEGEGQLDGTDTADDTDAAGQMAENDPYPYTLWEFDVKSSEKRVIGDLPYVTVYPSDDSGKLFFTYYDSDTGGSVVRATYILEV